VSTDYDAPRQRTGDDNADANSDNPIAMLEARQRTAGTAATEPNELSEAEDRTFGALDLLSLSDDGDIVSVAAKQENEFTCSVCFLVYHRILLARSNGRRQLCRDCA
jgi:hypothetical protein